MARDRNTDSGMSSCIGDMSSRELMIFSTSATRTAANFSSLRLYVINKSDQINQPSLTLIQLNSEADSLLSLL